MRDLPHLEKYIRIGTKPTGFQNINDQSNLHSEKYSFKTSHDIHQYAGELQCTVIFLIIQCSNTIRRSNTCRAAVLWCFRQKKHYQGVSNPYKCTFQWNMNLMYAILLTIKCKTYRQFFFMFDETIFCSARTDLIGGPNIIVTMNLVLFQWNSFDSIPTWFGKDIKAIISIASVFDTIDNDDNLRFEVRRDWDCTNGGEYVFFVASLRRYKILNTWNTNANAIIQFQYDYMAVLQGHK